MGFRSAATHDAAGTTCQLRYRRPIKPPYTQNQKNLENRHKQPNRYSLPNGGRALATNHAARQSLVRVVSLTRNTDG